MNPIDLLAAQALIDRTMRGALPDAPQVLPKTHRHRPARSSLARAASATGGALLKLSQRLDPGDCPASAGQLSLGHPE